jgi:formylglycine-generating enzyme required for sulfatase activity/predicted Ser/Thr protein kinase
MQPFGQLLAIGTMLEGRYRIVAQLGQGRMSRVYLADALRLGMRVAVKENLQTDPASQTQFEREAQILARLSHPNLPRVTDHFTDPTSGRQYLVMDFIEGEDLEKMIVRVGRLPEQTALAWTHQILSALDYLHAQNPPVIHRDIKPANIKITSQGKAVLVDFGIAKLQGGGTFTGARAVTPGFAPPEQYGMRTDARSDVYALGATLYTLLTGRVPPEAPLRSAGDQLIPPRQLVPGISAPIENAIWRALEMQPTQRWQSAREFYAALSAPPIAQTVAAQPANAPVVAPTRTVAPRVPVWLWAVGGAGAMFVLGLFLFGVFAFLLRPTPTPAPTAPPPIAVPATKVPEPTKAPDAPRAGDTRVFAPDNAPMQFVPAGEFTMGSNEYGDEKPIHMVYLDAFWMDKYEVTNTLYAACVNAGKCTRPSQTKSSTRDAYFGNSQFNNYPVIYVDWNQAKTYCEWAGKRLPTEAEWEKAARGTDARIYPWGNSFDGTKLNYSESNPRPGDTTQVGAYSSDASPYGIMDLSGNVVEWVADWYGENYYASSPRNNPTGPSSGQSRVLRGGSWINEQQFTRAANRFRGAVTNSYLNVGFRCARGF